MFTNKLLVKSEMSPKSSGASFINNLCFSRSLIVVKSFSTNIMSVIFFASVLSFPFSVSIVSYS